MIEMQFTRSPVCILSDATSAMERVYMQFDLLFSAMEMVMSADVGEEMAKARCNFITAMMGDYDGKEMEREGGTFSMVRRYRVTHSALSSPKKKF